MAWHGMEEMVWLAAIAVVGTDCVTAGVSPSDAPMEHCTTVGVAAQPTGSARFGSAYRSGKRVDYLKHAT